MAETRLIGTSWHPELFVSSPYRLLILNGFDRSGTTMVAQVLSEHPSVESLIQPFSSTVVHETQWEYWSPGESHPAVEVFVDGLRAGEVDEDFLASDWFEDHSSTREMISDRLHVVKSTKLHFKAAWFQQRFSDIPFWAVYRDPRAVICSLLRNDFYRDWYGESAYREVARHVREDAEIPGSLRDATLSARDELEKMSAIVAVRSEVMFRSVPPSRTLLYENVVDRPNRTLNELLSRFGFDRVDFREAMQRDHNLVGESYRGPDRWRDWIDSSQEERIAEFFQEVVPVEAWP